MSSSPADSSRQPVNTADSSRQPLNTADSSRQPLNTADSFRDVEILYLCIARGAPQPLVPSTLHFRSDRALRALPLPRGGLPYWHEDRAVECKIIHCDLRSSPSAVLQHWKVESFVDYHFLNFILFFSSTFHYMFRSLANERCNIVYSCVTASTAEKQQVQELLEELARRCE